MGCASRKVIFTGDAPRSKESSASESMELSAPRSMESSVLGNLKSSASRSLQSSPHR